MAVPYAVSRGVSRGVPRSVPSRLFGGGLLSSTFLSTYGPYGMVMDFTDASISINDSTDVLDYSSQGTVSATTGALLGPGSKLTYSAPSAKLTEQADGYLAFQAHNLILRSNDIANGAWVTTNSTKTSTAAGPFGSTAQLMTVASNANNALFFGPPVDSAAAGKVYYHAADLKAGTATWVTVEMWTGTGNLAAAVWVNLQTGALGSNVSTTNFTYLSSSITPISDGYYRVTIEAQATATATNMYWACRVTDGNGVFAFTAVSGLTYYVARPQSTRTPVASYDYVATTSAAVYDLPYVYSSGVKTGILVEPAATNLCLYSWDLTNASNWNVQNLTKVANAGTALDGTETALLVYPVSSGTGRRFTASPTTTAVTHTMSINAEYSGIAWVYMFKFDGSAPAAWFNVQTGTIGTVAGGYTAAITPTPTGGYRLSVTGTAPSGSSFAGYIGLASSDNSVSVTANGTDGVIFTAAQMETGTVATSPIITYGAAVTRAADNISMAVTLFPFTSATSTLFTYAADRLVGDPRYAALSNGASERYLEVFGGTAGLQRVYAGAGTGPTAIGTSAANPTRVAVAMAANDFAASVDGGSITTDVTLTVTQVPTNLYVGRYGGGSNYANSLIKVVAYFPERKADATLQTMTTA